MDSSIQDQRLMNVRLSRPLGLTLVVLSTIAILLLDIWANGYNLPTLYVIPLMLFAQTNRSRGILVLAAILCVLTLGKYGSEFVPGLWASVPNKIFQFRLVNRLLNAVSLAVCGLVLQRWRHFNQMWELQRAQNPQEQSGRLAQHAFRAMSRLMAVALAAAVTAAIFAIDILTPPEINLPILYVTPLVIIGLTCSWRMTFATLVVLLVLAVVGYYLPIQGEGTASAATQCLTPMRLLTNRSLACAGLCGAAAVIYLVRRVG
jgi:ABC-type multidrug transport system fused ATPase/permease subunit